MDSVMTAEQRRRTEENRLKAIEKRNAAIARNAATGPASTSVRPYPRSTSSFSQPLSNPNPSSNFGNPVHVASSSDVLQHEPTKVVPPTNPPTGTGFGVTSTGPVGRSVRGPSSSSFFKHSTGSNVRLVPPPQKLISGSCVLLSRERFFVDMAYHAESIAVFKSIPSSKYGKYSLIIFFWCLKNFGCFDAFRADNEEMDISC